ncbi:MAG: flagellar hook capping FlgD N-terminal domain-containing protein [Terracidiphilus sp.]|jgi:flagellar basal-body rod modification protein FlgD
MAAAAAGIFNHQMTAGQALGARSATPMATASSGTGGTSSASSSSGNSATISANDFLTLLVTEMQNQDPTATTDPNEYINQLVNVNSLQQLIAINQTLSTDLTTPAATSTGGTTTPASPSAAKSEASVFAKAQPATPSPAAGVTGSIQQAATALAPGNLSVPATNQAASRVAQSLSGRPRAD